MSTDSASLATAYFDAWESGDTERLRPILADDVSFRGPLAEVDGAGDYVDAIRGLFTGTERLVIHRRWADGDDALTWFDMHLPGAPPAPVASWIHVRDGRIDRVRVTFDPRGILAAAPS
jgi:ketosteroid isomerase-like protein